MEDDRVSMKRYLFFMLIYFFMLRQREYLKDMGHLIPPSSELNLNNNIEIPLKKDSNQLFLEDSTWKKYLRFKPPCFINTLSSPRNGNKVFEKLEKKKEK